MQSRSHKLLITTEYAADIQLFYILYRKYEQVNLELYIFASVGLHILARVCTSWDLHGIMTKEYAKRMYKKGEIT